MVRYYRLVCPNGIFTMNFTMFSEGCGQIISNGLQLVQGHCYVPPYYTWQGWHEGCVDSVEYGLPLIL